MTELRCDECGKLLMEFDSEAEAGSNRAVYERPCAAQLRDLMELAGMDNDALAAATGIKVSKILSCRTSNAMPKVMDAVRLARALGVSVELLMTGEEL